MANRERLLKALHEIELAEALRLEQPEVNLELHWKQWAWAVKTDVHSTGRGSMIMDCGTGMCVARWGATSPATRSSGLSTRAPRQRR